MGRDAIRVIQTTYSGIKFRSRLEARWAVFFDALKIRWDYEPEAFALPDGLAYLPDFRLGPNNDGDADWFEVKPSGALNDAEVYKLRGFTEALPHPERLLLVRGAPWSCELLCCDKAGPWAPPLPQYFLCCLFTPFPIPEPDAAERAAGFARSYRFWDPPRQGAA